MFRKKAVGPVVVLDDNDADNQQFNDLGLDDNRDAAPAAGDLDNMTSEQLEKLAISSAKAGKESTARALNIATEAREIGANTAQKMQQQTAQLEKMSEDIEVVHDYLDKSEHTIEKMTKPIFARLFKGRKQTGKGLNSVKSSRKEQDAREKLRSKGLDSVDLKGIQAKDGSVPMHDIQRAELLDDDTGSATKTRLPWTSKKSREAEAPVETRAIREDYSEYTPEVADVLRQQDDDLDQIGDLVSDMKGMGEAMNHELEYQDKLINEVQDFSSETSKRTKDNARKIAKIK